MNYLLRIFLGLCSILFSLHALSHEGCVKHNMLLFGEDQVFASHIVYKSPHNYQVILKINFEKEIADLYLKEKKRYPKDQFIFLLDSMDIKQISTYSQLSGTISRTNELEQKTELAVNVKVARDHFELIYFDELPLSLEAAPKI